MNIIKYFGITALLFVTLELTGCANDQTMRSQSYADFNMTIPSLTIDGKSAVTGNVFQSASTHPQSTFYPVINSNSYGNFRRTVDQGEIPSAVRLAEWINYFNYDYPNPDGKVPVKITTEIAPAPWNESAQLMLIGVTTRPTQVNLPNNIVVLVDISSGRDSSDIVGLVKNALKELAESLRPEDKIAFISYSSMPTVALESISGSETAKIKKGINHIDFGAENTPSGAIGSINLAYKELENNLIKNGNNLILFVTDGDLATNKNGMNTIERTISRKSSEGIAFSTLVFSKGQYNYQNMQKLADLGGGTHAYIDTLNEAGRAIDRALSGHEIVAFADELNVEFNPEYVHSYRLLGYEKNNVKTVTQDGVYASRMREGKTFTALYELNLIHKDGVAQPNKYPEIGRISLRYKIPSQTVNYVLEHSLVPTQVKNNVSRASKDFTFAASVAAIALQLRNDSVVRGYPIDDNIKLARDSIGKDELGLRAEFVRLLESIKLLSTPASGQ